MHPEIVLPLLGSIHSYTLFTLLGAAAGLLLAVPLLRRAGLTCRSACLLLVTMMLSFLAGARLLNFLANPDAYTGTLRLLTLRLAGFSLYGGIAGAMLALVAVSRPLRFRTFPVLDALVLPAGMAFALARLGCFLNGCCSGIPTDSPLAVSFPARGTGNTLLPGILGFLGNPDVSVHPTQLYELTLALIGLIPVLWLYFRRRPREGTAFLLYGIWFSSMRWAVLPLRLLPYPSIITGLVYPLLYGSTIAAGLVLLLRLYRKDPIRSKENPDGP